VASVCSDSADAVHVGWSAVTTLIRRGSPFKYDECTPPGYIVLAPTHIHMKNRILPKQIKDEREARIEAQGGCCALCGAPILDGDRVHLDHCHDTGVLRGSLHGSCNLLLGKLERGLKFGIRDPQGFLENLATYVISHRENPGVLLHPTFLSPDEKKLRQKKRAARRKKKSVTNTKL